ncbi:MAG: hypothetical protein KME29_01875 [Calothrix sp. FI2-JRJ7]|nr:hypothetical protein [Calothrix sp. FI2-JRJ7]
MNIESVICKNNNLTNTQSRVSQSSILTINLGAKLTMKLGMLIIVICLGLILFQLGSILAIGLILVAGIGFGLIFESQIP